MKHLKKYNEVVNNDETLSMDDYAEKIDQILAHLKKDIRYFKITPMSQDWVIYKGIIIDIGEFDIERFDIDDYHEELQNLIEYMFDEDFEVTITSSFHYNLISNSNNLEKIIEESKGRANLYTFSFNRPNKSNEGFQTHQNHLRRIMNQKMEVERVKKRIRFAMSEYIDMIENITVDIRSDIKDFKIIPVSKSWIRIIIGRVNGNILDIKPYHDELKNMIDYMIDEDFVVELKTIRGHIEIYDGNNFEDMMRKVEKGELYLFNFHKEKTR